MWKSLSEVDLATSLGQFSESLLYIMFGSRIGRYVLLNNNCMVTHVGNCL